MDRMNVHNFRIHLTMAERVGQQNEERERESVAKDMHEEKI